MILNKRILTMSGCIRLRSDGFKPPPKSSRKPFPDRRTTGQFHYNCPVLLDDNLVEKKLFDGVKKRFDKISGRIAGTWNFGGPEATPSVTEWKLREIWGAVEEMVLFGEPLLFKERWDKHFSDVLDNDLTCGDDCWNVDLSRIGDLYDSIRYDHSS